MDIIILTSNLFGSASLHLKELSTSEKVKIKMVVLSEGKILNKKKHYLRRFKKFRKVGLLGALNGIRMRKWYTDRVFEYVEIEPIDKLCKDMGIPFKTTPTINCNKTLEIFEEAKVGLGLSIGNTYISKKVFSIPKYGMINIHYEELPEYQNAIGVIWQLYNKSTHTGYTIHEIDRHIDTGDILKKERMPILFRDSLKHTVANTYANIWKKATKGMKLVVEDFEHHQENKNPQTNGKIYTTPSGYEFLMVIKNFKQLKRTVKTKNPSNYHP
ncbi:MAG: formyltransferase family protein [Bacteroidota bacterium]